MAYLKRITTRRPPQSAPIPGSTQVPNSAGGYTWSVDDWTRLRRFLVLGSEGGTYYASEQALTLANADAVARCIAADGVRAVSTIVEVSERGAAPKNDPALFALAMAAGLGDVETRRAALDALPRVARTGMHLFRFTQFVEGFRGWGRSLRRGIGRWYAAQSVDALAYQAVKYRQREGVTHRDLLRLAHPAAAVGAGNPTLDVSDGHRRLFEWIVRGGDRDGLPRIVEGFARAQSAETPAATAELVREYGLPREALKSEHLTSPRVWEALLDDMPSTALIRNLATMTRIGLLTPGSRGDACRRRAAGQRRAAPTGPRAPDRGALGPADVRVGPRCPRPGRVDSGAGDRRRARRGVLRGVRGRRAGRHPPAARARRVGLDAVGPRGRRPGPEPA